MSESESIKADIAFHEKLFFAAMAVNVSLVGWTVSVYLAIPSWILMSALIVLTSTCFLGIHQYRKIKTLIRRLKDV